MPRRNDLERGKTLYYLQNRNNERSRRWYANYLGENWGDVLVARGFFLPILDDATLTKPFRLVLLEMNPFLNPEEKDKLIINFKG